MVNREWMIELVVSNRIVNSDDIEEMRAFSGVDMNLYVLPTLGYGESHEYNSLSHMAKVSILINLCFDKIRDDEKLTSK